MKKILLLALALLLTTSSFSQERKKPVVRGDKYNITVKKPWKQFPGETPNVPRKTVQSSVANKPGIAEDVIGITRYDLQSGGSTISRVYIYPDNTVGAAWLYGMEDPGFTDRGTAYNYFDGTNWGLQPGSRIETVKTGYPSYTPYGPNGEATLAHDFNTPGGMVLCKRDQKGNGNWGQITIPGPAGQNGLGWPRMTSSGNNHQYLHTIAITRPTAYSGTLYQGLNGAILYSRSADGGNTWDISNALLPGMTSAEYNGFESNSYAFAEPVGNTIAFVVGDTWTDLFLMKSTDNGDTWTKTVIFQHPYPKFDETQTLVLDTPWVCDGGVAVALDNQGKAHVFFGLMRVLNTDLTDGSTSYFPYTDGLAYWNEDMAPFENLNFDTLWNQDHLVGYLQDINGNDTVMEFVGIGIYYLSLSGMPTVSVNSLNTIYVCFASVMENLDNGSENYRHILGTYKAVGQDWSAITDVTGSVIHNFDECVFPFLAPVAAGYNNYLVYQKDDNPGMATWGPDPLDPYGDNYIVAGKIILPHIDSTGIDDQGNASVFSTHVSPNPCSTQVEISVELIRPAILGLEIMNIMGQAIYTVPPANYATGSSVFKLDVSAFTPGLYFYTLTTGDGRVTNKIVVQHE